MRHKWEFGPPEDTRKKACDRCGLMDATVTIRTGCDQCGPVPLCQDCHEVHEGEIQIEKQGAVAEYDG